MSKKTPDIFLIVGADQDQQKGHARDWYENVDQAELVILWLQMQKEDPEDLRAMSDSNLDIMSRLASIALCDLALDHAKAPDGGDGS